MSCMIFGYPKEPCSDCIEWNGRKACTMNCGPSVPAAPTAALPAGFKVICSLCGESLEAETHFAKGQLKKKHPRCRACAPNKFQNLKDAGGASRKESRRAQYLRTLRNAGLIRDLRDQVKFELLPTQYGADGKLLERSVNYIADFVYVDEQGTTHVEDAKGMRTDVYRLKKKLMLSIHKIRIEEV